ncbi:hypothetical protein I6N95_19835 [Vagococcus sp. BWB3-3]|uniref:GHKL domain-containing protein n=1 Tax=Vagococcus allomyrinae TaxID=2794353 RepID=A0A940PBX4_9ENTE|nr:hypothetical protein [Vagococcus allomyrinae]MBP1043276.1 hypothetical protein [Vagococcus allomyrinae]
MGVTVVEVYIFNFFSSFIEIGPVAALAFFTLREKYSWRCKLGLILLLSLSYWLINSLLTDISLPSMSFRSQLLAEVLFFVVQVILCRIFIRKPAMTYLGLVSFYKVFFHMVGGIVAIIRVIYLRDLSTLSAEVICIAIYGLIAMVVIIILVWHQPGFLLKVYDVFQMKSMIFFTVLGVTSYALLPIIVDDVLQQYLELEPSVSLIVINVYLFLIAVSLYSLVNLFANSLSQKQILKDHHMTILQQEMYIKRLESIQKEMRLLRHDYKNILASAYLDESGVNLEEGQLYLNEKLASFDQNIVDNIRLLNQLSAIELIDIRSFILGKIDELATNQIAFNLEVHSPVSVCPVNVADLMRCLDLLMTEAVREITQLEKPKIDLVILQEAKVLTIIVKYQTIEGSQSKMPQEYDQIIKKYHKAVRRTLFEEGKLLQVLKLS